MRNYIISVTADELSALKITVKRWTTAVGEMLPEDEDQEFSKEEIQTLIALTCDFLEVLIPLIKRANDDTDLIVIRNRPEGER